MANTNEVLTVNSLQSMIDAYRSAIINTISNLITYDSSNISSVPNFFPTNITANKNQLSNSVPTIFSNKMTGNTSDYKVQQNLQVTGNNLIAQFVNSLAICSKYALIKVQARTTGNQGPTAFVDQGQQTYFLLDNLPTSISFKTDTTSWQSYSISKTGRGTTVSIFNDGAVVPGVDLSTTLMPTISELANLQSGNNKIKTNEEVNASDVNSNSSILAAMYTWWNDQKMTYQVNYTRCYNDCHSSCHHSGRGWR